MREVKVGQPLAATAKGRQARCGVGEKSVFILSLGLVLMHEGEYRWWHPSWGHPSEDLGDEEWQNIVQPAVVGP